MCLSPLTIKNPYFEMGKGFSYKLRDGTVKQHNFRKSLNFLRNTHDTHIQVPCGHCSQCVSMRQMWFVQRVQMESFRSHLFMLTLTYQDSALHYTDCGDYHIAYPDYTDVQKMLKRIRKRVNGLRYWFVSEYGTKSFRPHFHAILALDKDLNKESVINLEQTLQKVFMSEWKRNYGSKRNPLYKPLCKFVRKGNKSTFDLHHIEPLLNHDNDCSFYIAKYICKYDSRIYKLMQKILLDNSITPEQSSELLSLLKPRSVMSKDFGDYNYPLIKDYILKGLKSSDQLPQYFDIYSGRSSLLSPYYRKHLLPTSWYINRYIKYSEDMYSYMPEDVTTIYDTVLDSNKAQYLQDKFDRIKSHLFGVYSE